MNVVFVSAEVAPLAKTGGLGDVSSALPAALHELGANVSVIMPLYGSIDRVKLKLADTGARVRAWMDGRYRDGFVFKYGHRRKSAPVYLIDSPDYFAFRRGLYGADRGDYLDNAYRFGFFARAAIEATKALELAPDVFHVNDWQSALLPVYLGLIERAHPILSRAGVVTTIHNLAYQGVFGKETLPRLGLPWSVFHMEALEYFDRVSFLKGGMAFSHYISTVSPTYAREIQTPDYGASLDSYLRRWGSDLVGILNGIDTVDWDPATDDALFARYSADDPAPRGLNKIGLQKRLGLRENPDALLLGAVGRLDPQKGYDLFIALAPTWLSEGLQIVILGSGNRGYLEALSALRDRYPGQLSLNEGFQEELGRQIYAGVDLFLMPSRYEPCGLGQMIALRYGAVPVVRYTGGLVDSVVDVDADPDRGTGFFFGPFDARALHRAVDRARGRFGDREGWRALVRRGMRVDFSWKRSAEKYLELYERAVARARHL